MITAQQEIAAQAAVVWLRGAITVAKLQVYAGAWVTHGYGEPDDAINALNAIERNIGTLGGPTLERVRRGEITFDAWAGYARGYKPDIEYVVGATGISAELDALSEVPGDISVTVGEITQEIADAAPGVAVGLGLVVAMGIGLFLWLEFRR